MTVAGDWPAQRPHVDEVAFYVDDGRNGSHVAGAHDDVVAGHNTGSVGCWVEERPREAGVVHRVQIDDEVEVLHGPPFSLHGTGSV